MLCSFDKCLPSRSLRVPIPSVLPCRMRTGRVLYLVRRSLKPAGQSGASRGLTLPMTTLAKRGRQEEKHNKILKPVGIKQEPKDTAITSR